jgi:hypothetical protein
MHRSTYFAISLLAAVVAFAPGARAQVSAGEPDSTENQRVVPGLTNFGSLSTILNLARGTVRIVAVVTPSSPAAIQGLDILASVLDDIPSKRLRVYVLLSPAGPNDSKVRALNLAARNRDRRIVYLWDGDAAVAVAMAPLVGLEDEPAQDVYFLYDTDATFNAEPATPVLSMNLNPHVDGLKLEAQMMRERAEELVRAVEKKAAGAASGRN